jgi:hypothetical protein
MGYIRRKKSGKIINGSNMIVPNQGISLVNPGGDNKINQQKKIDTNAPS